MIELETTNGLKINVVELQWEEARILLESVDKILVFLIDSVSPSKFFKLYKATYPFGATVINNGLLYFSNFDNNKSIEFNSSELPNRIKNSIEYNPLNSSPLAILLNKNSESYCVFDNQPFLSNLMTQGSIIGLKSLFNRLYDINEPFSNLEKIVAGSRNIFMLSKLSDATKHKNFQTTYDLKQNRPETFFDHWLIFKELAKLDSEQWSTEYLFFSNDWIDCLVKDPAWQPIVIYLLGKTQSLQSYKNIVELNMLLGYIDRKRGLRFAADVLDLAKHLFVVASGIVPCFKPSVDDSSAPIKFIQEAYIKGYGLDISPIIMEPGYLNYLQSDIGYYFPNYPTSPQLELKNLSAKSLLSFIKDVQVVTNIYQKYFLEYTYTKYNTISTLIQKVKLSYYHNNIDQESVSGINNISTLIKKDIRLSYNYSGDFPKHSPLLSGCISITC